MLAFRGTRVIDDNGECVKVNACREPIVIGGKSLLSEVKAGMAYEFIYFVYPQYVEMFVEPELYDSYYSLVSLEMFVSDPVAFGICVYKDEKGEVRFE